MKKNPGYCEGYAAGDWDGVRDAEIGRVSSRQALDMGKMPVRAMGISARGYNCLTCYGCTWVEDVVSLNAFAIRSMRNLGPKTASEIAAWLAEHGLDCGAWSDCF